MDKLDKLIEQSLNEEDRQIMADTAELGYFELGLKQFRGKLGWVTWVIMIVQATMFLIGVWCTVQFFAATDMLLALKWGLSAAVLILAATTIKVSLMPQMQADRILRELKRVELMLASRQ
jgi:ABC-type multidrug transport system fused ATPase/permease subunit